MTRFLIDAQLPPALARWLTEQGYQSEHVFDFGGDVTTDRQVWSRALETRAVIDSKDEDFSMLTMQSLTGPQVVWIRAGNTSRKALLVWFEGLLPSILLAIERGERVIEIA
jgi:predicted nuclease of predicted toxin-antitoxin system